MNSFRILLASSIAVRKSPTLKLKLIVILNAAPSLSHGKYKLDSEGKLSHPDGRHHMVSPSAPRGLGLAAGRLKCAGQTLCKAPISIVPINLTIEEKRQTIVYLLSKIESLEF